jgi:hypothetical protein
MFQCFRHDIEFGPGECPACAVLDSESPVLLPQSVGEETENGRPVMRQLKSPPPVKLFGTLTTPLESPQQAKERIYKLFADALRVKVPAPPAQLALKAKRQQEYDVACAMAVQRMNDERRVTATSRSKLTAEEGAAWSAKLRELVKASDEKRKRDTAIVVQPMFEHWE